jgi:hypothetical protein
MAASPDDPRHKSLLDEVTGFLAAQEFYTYSKTYHESGHPPQIVEFLKRFYSPTALHIRAMADRIAINPNLPLAFYYDAKTSGVRSSGRKDLCIEALPLADHVHHAARGVLCLYCVRDADGTDRGFWCNELPEIRQIFVPGQRVKIDDWYENVISAAFPDVEVRRISTTAGGSNDPFAVIDYSTVLMMSSWKKLLEEAIGRIKERKVG